MSEGRLCSSRVVLRAAVWLAAAFIIITTGGVRSAAAGPATGPSPAVPSDLQAIVTQLAATADAGGSCDAGFSPATPFGAFPGGGAFAAAAGGLPPAPPAPGALAVMCALPYTNGKTGADCNGKHNLAWKVVNGSANAKVTAELMGLDAGGNTLQSFLVYQGGPAATMGGTAHLNSRLSPADWKFTRNKTDYSIFAPIPMFKVTVEDGGETATAFCSNIPYVDVTQPSGGVVAADGDGNSETTVFAAVPRTNPLALHLYVDNVDLLAPGVMVPPLPVVLTNCDLNNPCAGTATVNGNAVEVTDLVVDVATSIDRLSSNTVRATLNNLSCGGHYVRVSSSKATEVRFPVTSACLVDDLTERASASVFAVSISQPASGEIVALDAAGTTVVGEVCSGSPIVDVMINGKSLNSELALGQVYTPGVDEASGPGTYTFPINTTLGTTNLRDDFDGTTTSLGTFDPGSNRLQASAMESQGTRAFKRLVFAVGNNIKPLAIDPSAQVLEPLSMQATMNARIQEAVESRLQVALTATSTDIKNAFIVGLSADGAQTIMTNLCNAAVDHDGNPDTANLTPGQLFKQTVEDVLDNFTESAPLTSFAFEPPCSCNANVKVWISEVDAGTNVSCPITFENDKIKVSLVLPNVEVTVRAYGYESCFANSTEVDVTSKVELNGIHFDYTITEGDILGSTTTVGANPFTIGGQLGLEASGGVEYGVLADICNFFLDGFVTVLTFGTVDIGPFLYPEIDITEEINFQEEIGPAKPDAIPLKGIHIQEQTVDPYHQKMSGEIGLVTDIQITPEGITAGLKGTFATTKVDLGVESNPGIEVKEPSVPAMAALIAQGAKDATVGLSQDAINMMFASLAGGGDMKMADSDDQGCFPAGAKVGDLLPASCDTIDLGVGADVGTALARGYCHAVKGSNCATLVYNNPALSAIDNANLTAGEIGTCWGGQGQPVGQSCWDVSGGNLITLGACSITPNLHLNANQNIMFCAKGDIPTMGFPDVDGALNTVPAELHLNDLSVSLVIDRSGPGGTAPNAAVDGLLKDLPGCFSGTQTTSDCNVMSACLDINVNFAMNNIICSPGKPGFQAEFQSIKILTREVGMVCSGRTTPTSDGDALETASDSTVTEPIALNAGVLSPPICGAGLDMGGFVTCGGAQIMAIEADADPDFREFLAITCDLN